MMTATCTHPSCPHEARKRTLLLEKKAKELPAAVLPMGEISSGQLCDGNDCGLKFAPGASAWAHSYMPWTLCDVCVEKYRSKFKSFKSEPDEYGSCLKAFVPTRRNKVDMRIFWIHSKAV